MPISKILLERIETFRRNLESYTDPEYKEARVRQEFIDPFFSALGWDMKNESGYAEAYKDVVHEDTASDERYSYWAPLFAYGHLSARLACAVPWRRHHATRPGEAQGICSLRSLASGAT